MENKLVGKVDHINVVEFVGSMKIYRHTFILEITTNLEYRNFVEIEIPRKNKHLADSLSVGQMIECYFNLRGKKYQKTAGGGVRVYPSFLAWRIEQIERSNVVQKNAGSSPHYRIEKGGCFDD